VLRIVPYSQTDENYYSQLFSPWPKKPPNGSPASASLIKGFGDLVDAMNDDGTKVCLTQPQRIVDAGYTYFGQFLDHDLTDDQSSADDVWVFGLRPNDVLNGQTPRLDLGHLYGRGPWDTLDKRLYEPNDVRLKVGYSPGFPRSFDIAVEKGKPLVADTRACENVILRQMTALFARLHNQAVNQFRGEAGSLRELFHRARLATTWQFQRLVCIDYLQELLDPEVYRSLFVRRDPPKIGWSSFSIPAEFSVAAMRFGHSMVRDSYFLSDAPDRDLLTLLRTGRTATVLDSKWEIDWGRFFNNAGEYPTITTRPIDTKIAPGLLQVPVPTLRLFNTGSPSLRRGDNIKLPVVTLVRGLGLGLNTGQYAAQCFKHDVKTEELTRDCDGHVTEQGRILMTNKLVDDTPLWYYVLKESELYSNGNYLGPTGSRIVGETVHAALANDCLSYWNHPDPEAKMFPEWHLPKGKRELKSLSALFGAARELQ
jgi:hypothetical protein